jgi:hypothetical protein
LKEASAIIEILRTFLAMVINKKNVIKMEIGSQKNKDEPLTTVLN